MGIVAMVCQQGDSADSSATDAKSYFGKDDLADRVPGVQRTLI
jgi:hypothetical protein